MFGWDREAITSDGGRGFYYGHAQSVGAAKIYLADPPHGPYSTINWAETTVFVLGGKGMGQFARVARHLGQEVELDKKLKVALDQTSVITIVRTHQNYIFSENDFEDTGVAIQFYGTALNHIVANNRSVRTGGFISSGRYYLHYQPNWYCQFLKNDIVVGNYYRGGPNNNTESGRGVFAVLGLQRPPNSAPLSLGIIVRGNSIESNGQFVIQGVSKSAPGVDSVIVEHNQTSRSPEPIEVDDGVAGAVIRDNKFNPQ